MSELFVYKCPSCGANLKPHPDDAAITCSFCGSVVQRLPGEEEKKRLSASKLEQSTIEYKSELHEYNGLSQRLTKLEEQVTRLARQDTQPPLWTDLLIPAQVVCALGLTAFLVHAIQIKSTPIAVFVLLLFAALAVFTVVSHMAKRKAQQTAASQREQLKQSLSELTTAREEMAALEQHFDIDALPAEYRNDTALDYVIGLFKTGQASDLGEAFRRYDEHSHYKKMETLQSEQVAIQKRQLEIMDELAAYDFDDTYDDDDFTLHETVKAFRQNNKTDQN